MDVRVGVIVVQGGAVLMMCHRRMGQSYWVVPGGKVDRFESIEEAARRELVEETGLRIRLGPLVAAFDFSDRTSRRVLNLVFAADVLSGKLSLPSDGPLARIIHDFPARECFLRTNP